MQYSQDYSHKISNKLVDANWGQRVQFEYQAQLNLLSYGSAIRFKFLVCITPTNWTTYVCVTVSIISEMMWYYCRLSILKDMRYIVIYPISKCPACVTHLVHMAFGASNSCIWILEGMWIILTTCPEVNFVNRILTYIVAPLLFWCQNLWLGFSPGVSSRLLVLNLFAYLFNWWYRNFGYSSL